MIYIMFNDIDSSKNYMNYLFDSIVQKNQSLYENLLKLEDVIFIFFRVKSLVEIKEITNLENKHDIKEHEHELGKINKSNYDESKLSELNHSSKINYSKSVLAFHTFLRDGNSNPWFTCLSEEADYFKAKGEKGDVNGLMFTLINQSAINFMKTGRISDTANDNFNIFMKLFKEKYKLTEGSSITIKEKTNKEILQEYKARFELAIEFYKKLYDYEEQLKNEQKELNDFLKKKVKNKESNKLKEKGIKHINDKNQHQLKKVITGELEDNKLSHEIESVDKKENSNDFIKNDDNDDNIDNGLDDFMISNFDDSLASFYEETMKQKIEKDIEKGNKVIMKILLKQLINIYEKDQKNNTLSSIINQSNEDKKEISSGLPLSYNEDPVSFKHIQLSLKLLDCEDISWRGLNILNIDSEVIKSFNELLMNLCKIKEKFILLNHFKKYKLKTLGYVLRSEYVQIRAKYFKDFSANHFLSLCEGDTFLKLNYTSNGEAEHFYILDELNRNFLIFKNKKEYDNNKKPKKYNFIQISKIVHGLSTENAKRQFKILSKRSQEEKFKSTFEYDNPCNYISIVLHDRTLDFFLDDEKLKKLYYGLHYFIKENSLITEIPSVLKFNLDRLKMRIIKKLLDFYIVVKSNEKIDQNFGFSGELKSYMMLVLEKISTYIYNDVDGFLELPLVKVLCFYWRIKDEIDVLM